MLGWLALKWRWRARREIADQPTDRPNLVMGAKDPLAGSVELPTTRTPSEYRWCARTFTGAARKESHIGITSACARAAAEVRAPPSADSGMAALECRNNLGDTCTRMSRRSSSSQRCCLAVTQSFEDYNLCSRRAERCRSRPWWRFAMVTSR